MSFRKRKKKKLSSRSRSQQGLIWSKYNSFYSVFWAVDSLATKLGLMIHHHKPECPVKRIGLLHSGSRSQQRVKMSMFVQMISSKLLVHMQPNLVWLYSIINGNVLCKNVITALKVKVTANLQNVSKCLFAYRLKRGTFCYQTSYAVAASWSRCHVEKIACCLQGQAHSKGSYDQNMTLSTMFS